MRTLPAQQFQPPSRSRRILIPLPERARGLSVRVGVANGAPLGPVRQTGFDVVPNGCYYGSDHRFVS